ncbi:hypothetical protein BIT28_18860 [Photobacterium proteolyticum]|uniref:BF1531-like N-terminal domain-containing protein n=1 Tax=Photobacterium proteolyticum TaxID=1903952 RepID=A0A1Q9GN60_9GAMM|nr:HAD-IIIC family phosphatase [Photobacterium proteolyticum]OLQ76079.1 hypothetical protein BIT28_18860 [Photobacterium proteolyticum]
MKEFFLEPLNNVEILRNKNKIKSSLQPIAKKKIRLLVLSGSTVGELKEYIQLFLLNQGIDAEVIEGSYNSYYEEVMFSDLIETVSPDWVYIHTTNKNILKWPQNSQCEQEVDELFEREVSRISDILTKLDNLKINTIVNNFELPHYRNMGNYDFTSKYGYVNFVNRINNSLAELVSTKPNIYINDIMYLSSDIGLSKWFDDSYWFAFKYAIAPTALPTVAKSITNIVKSVAGHSKKTLVCDLDNTLWGGVIGDDGPEGVLVGQGNPKAESFLELQNYILQLKSRGIVLAINSKNEKKLAEEGIAKSSGSLSCDDFASFVANWEPKSQNIQRIETELNLFQDSFVFIDDNPAEIKQVSEFCPSVTCVTYSKSPYELIKQLDKEGYFEVSRLSAEDKKRAEYYKKNKLVNEIKNNAKNFDDYLKSLEMKTTIVGISEKNRERVVQLVNKTNQFNPNTSRVTDADFDIKYANNSSSLNLVADLEDIYGNNGIVSTLLSTVCGETVDIDIWVMSCRVFNRELEFALFDTFVNVCKSRSITTIYSSYTESPKNAYVANLYEKLGFKIIEQTSNSKQYRLDVSEYVNKSKNIGVTYEF